MATLYSEGDHLEELARNGWVLRLRKKTKEQNNDEKKKVADVAQYTTLRTRLGTVAK